MVEGVVEHAGQVMAEHAIAHLEFENLHERGVVFFELGDRDSAGVFFGVSLGIGAFHEPNAGPPGVLCGVANSGERGEVGVAFGAAEFFGKFRVTTGFATDRADVAADVAGSVCQAAAIGDESADFGAFGFVEGARAAGRKRGAGGRERGVGCREHGIAFGVRGEGR